MPKFNLEKLKEKEENLKYIKKLTGELRSKQMNELDSSDRWNVIRNTIIEVAKKSLDEFRNQAKKWYNIDCERAVLKRN